MTGFDRRCRIGGDFSSLIHVQISPWVYVYSASSKMSTGFIRQGWKRLSIELAVIRLPIAVAVARPVMGISLSYLYNFCIIPVLSFNLVWNICESHTYQITLQLTALNYLCNFDKTWIRKVLWNNAAPWRKLLDHGCARVAHCVTARWRNFSHYCCPLRQYDVWFTCSEHREALAGAPTAHDVHKQEFTVLGRST